MRQNLTSIVAIDRRGAIGCKNRLPWSIKSDMAFFRRTTMDHTVIMGRKTYDSIGGPLKRRNNLVLSHNAVLFESTDGCVLVNSVEEALAKSHQEQETFIVGGGATYTEFTHVVDRYLVTIVDHEADDADAFLAASIMAEFAAWPGQEMAQYAASPGQDEFAFRIMSYSAPDADERREMRKALANQHLEKRLNVVHRSPPRRRPASGGPAAVSF